VFAVALVLSFLGTPATAATSPRPSTETAPRAPATIGDDRIAKSLVHVAVHSPQYDDAIAQYLDTRTKLDQAQSTYAFAGSSLVELESLEARLQREVADSTHRHREAVLRLAGLRRAIQEMVVAAYIDGDTQLAPGSNLDIRDATRRASRRTLIDAITKAQLDAIARATRDRNRSGAELARARVLLRDVSTRRKQTRFARDASQAAGFMLTARLKDDAKAVADARLTAEVDGGDFAFVALDAYWRAATKMTKEVPSCRMRWEVLAGISRAEGHHGTWGGADLTATGTETKPIIGVRLDGGKSLAYVGDTDGGWLDGDPHFDHAVGPMQFLPGSWRHYAKDGNDDHKVDPQNMYDATLAAARLLCDRAAGFDTTGGLVSGLLHYNASLEYVRIVSGYIHAYDTLPLAIPSRP
jgi:membrane-bound lytic murein transglycosylase B